jgi:hypothetical protein
MRQAKRRGPGGEAAEEETCASRLAGGGELFRGGGTAEGGLASRLGGWGVRARCPSAPRGRSLWVVDRKERPFGRAGQGRRGRRGKVEMGYLGCWAGAARTGSLAPQLARRSEMSMVRALAWRKRDNK